MLLGGFEKEGRKLVGMLLLAVRGGGYPLSSSKYPTRRAMSADMDRLTP